MQRRCKHAFPRIEMMCFLRGPCKAVMKKSSEAGSSTPVSHLALNGRNIPFVNSAKYLGVIFDKKVTWRLHVEMIKAKALRKFIRLYSLFKSERLDANIKLTLHKALIRCVMTYASPAWEFAADTHLIKLQRLQNKVLRTIGNFPRRTLTHS
jgi:hypothetical protein